MNNSILEKYGENLTAVKYLVNPAVARDKELKELVNIISSSISTNSLSTTT